LSAARLRARRIGPFSLLQLVGVAGAAIVVAVALLVVTAPLSPGGANGGPLVPGSGFVQVGQPEGNLAIGEPAPELEGEIGGVPIQLHDLDGNLVRLADLRGKVVWLNFWATWCPPCQEETPVLRETYSAHADEGLELVAVSVQETSVDDVRAYAQRYGLDYTIGFDATAAVFHTYHGFGLPTQLFLDREGVIRQIVLGPVTRDQAETILVPLLAR
jgi:thiol-disulfide isomerase/thioredoxin